MSENEYTTESITLLRDLEAVRKRPGMYLGDTYERGLQHMILEVFSNAVDAALKVDKPTVSIHSLYPEVVIEDNGGGMPFEFNMEEGKTATELYLTRLHFSGTADKHAPHVHLGYNWGVGLAVVNAVSSLLDVKSWSKGKRWHTAYRQGEQKIPLEIIGEGEGRGTIISFAPDPEIFENVVINEQNLRSVIFQSVHLIPGLTVNFLNETFHSKNGLSDLLPVMTPWVRISYDKSFCFNEQIDDFHLNVCLSGNGDKLKNMNWVSWVNGGLTVQHGSHVKAVRKALKKTSWTAKSGLVHILHYNPCFAGPTRGKLELPGIEKRITEILIPRIEEHLKERDVM